MISGKTITVLLISALLTIYSSEVFSQSSTASEKKGEAIKWMTFEEALTLNKKKPKMIFIDVYTDWCGWCKKMDKETFAANSIASYINKKYYAVKFNAEQSESVTFKDQEFVNPNPGKAKSTHQLTSALLKNERVYPSYVILDKHSDWTFKLKGYKTPADLMPVLKFYGDEHYKKMSMGEFLQMKK
ncbi:MAG: DUF255 domain-containing protein [Lentimicrobium sp.]|nr:DUF255 domain-containing protein [Lentimicrobium sp.]